MRIAAVPVLLCCPPLAAQAWPTFFSAYQDGLAAQRRGDPAQAVRAFTRAIALEPQPGHRVKTYGLNFLLDYHPYLRLAEAELALGDLAGAEAALARSQALAAEPAGERDALQERLRQLRQPAVAAPALPAPAAEEPAALPAAVPAAPDLPPATPAATAATVPAPGPGAAPAAAGPPVPHPPVPTAKPAPAPAPRPAPAPAPSAPPVAAGAAPAAPGPAAAHPAWAGLAAGLAGILAALAALARRRRRAMAARSGPPAGSGAAAGTRVDLQFGPFTARRVLGRGSCATAYLARHRSSGQEVAIKVPHPHLAEDPGFRARFRREAALGALLDHPRVVRVVDPGPAEGDPWLAMAYLRGTTLEVHLARRGPLPASEAAGIAGDIAEAIAYAHAKGVVHRDLKPANVMLDERGAVVMDFGIARILDAALTTGTMFLGTPLYCAPEALAGPKAGPPADRYALGVMLFEMLAGHPPFQAESLFEVFEAQRFHPLPDLAALRPDLPPRLVRLVQRLCAKAPEDRPEDAETLAILDGFRPAGARLRP